MTDLLNQRDEEYKNLLGKNNELIAQIDGLEKDKAKLEGKVKDLEKKLRKKNDSSDDEGVKRHGKRHQPAHHPTK